MKVTLLTDAPYCFDVRAQRTVGAFLNLGISLSIFDQGFETEKSRALLEEGIQHFSSSIPTSHLGRFAWHVKNNIAPLASLRSSNQQAYEVLKSCKPDVIHLVNPFLGDAVLRYLQDEPKCRLVYEAYEYWPEYLRNEEFGVQKSIQNILALTEQSILLASSYFVAVSEPILNYYREIAPLRKASIIYNANVPKIREYAEADSSGRVNAPAIPKIIFSGQFVKDRHVDELLHALSKVEYPYSLTLLGSGPQESAYKKIIQENRLSKYVSIVPPVPASALIKKLSHFDVGINLGSPHTRQQNGAAPNKIFDYLRAGLAIVSNETDGIRSLGIDDCIVFTPSNDETALADVLNGLLSDENMLMSMKQRAEGKRNLFTTATESEKIETLYKELGAEK